MKNKLFVLINIVMLGSAFGVDFGPFHVDIDPEATLEQAKQKAVEIAQAASKKTEEAARIAFEKAKKAGEHASAAMLNSIASATIENPDFLISNAITILKTSRGIITPSVFIEICKRVLDTLVMQKKREGSLLKSVMDKYIVLLPLLAQTRSYLSLQNPQSVEEMRNVFRSLVGQTKADVNKKIRNNKKKYYSWIFEGSKF